MLQALAPAPTGAYVSADPLAYRQQMEPQIRSALPRAILATSSQTPAAAAATYAAQVRDFLVTWSASLPGIDDVDATTDPVNAGLHIGLSATAVGAVYRLAYAGAWLTVEEETAVRDWLGRIHRLELSAMALWDCGPACGGPDACHRSSNHAALHLEPQRPAPPTWAAHKTAPNEVF